MIEKLVCECLLNASQIEGLWIQLYAHLIVEAFRQMRALNSGPVTAMVYGFDPSGNYRVTSHTCLSSRMTSGNAFDLRHKLSRLSNVEDAG